MAVIRPICGGGTAPNAALKARLVTQAVQSRGLNRAVQPPLAASPPHTRCLSMARPEYSASAECLRPPASLRGSQPESAASFASPSSLSTCAYSPAWASLRSLSPPLSCCPHQNHSNELYANAQCAGARRNSSSQLSGHSPPASRLVSSAPQDGASSRCPQLSGVPLESGRHRGGGSMEVMPTTLRAGHVGSQSERNFHVGSPQLAGTQRPPHQMPAWTQPRPGGAGSRQMFRLRGERPRVCPGNALDLAAGGRIFCPNGSDATLTPQQLSREASPAAASSSATPPPAVLPHRKLLAMAAPAFHEALVVFPTFLSGPASTAVEVVAEVAPADANFVPRQLSASSAAPSLSAGGSTVLVETEVTSPSSTVDLHGQAGTDRELGRTPSAPDSLLSGGLDLSNSMSPHKKCSCTVNSSLTVSSNSSTAAKEVAPPDSKPAIEKVSPRRMASLPSPQRPHHSPHRAATVGDENAPPAGEAFARPCVGLEHKVVANEPVGTGRREVVSKMRSYWEGRSQGTSSPMRSCRRSPSEPNVLQDSNSETARRPSRSDSVKVCRPNSSLPVRHAGLVEEKRRNAGRGVRQKQLQGQLAHLFRSLCPDEAKEMEGQQSSSSSSESDPEDMVCSPRGRQMYDEGEEWRQGLEKENRALWKSQRHTLQVLTGYLKTRRPSSYVHSSCPDCATPLSCLQCVARAASDPLQLLDCASGKAVAALEPTTMEAPAARKHSLPQGGASARDAGGAFFEWPEGSPMSPMSPPTVQEEEPAGEPDAGILCL